MADPSRIVGSLHVTDTLSAGTLIPSDLAVTNAKVATAAAIGATKLQHQHRMTYAQESATTAADEARVLLAVYGVSGSIVQFEAGSVVANVGDSTVTVDLLKDGSSVLTAAIELNSSGSAYTPKSGVISSSALVDGDVLEVSINATVGTGTLAKGVYASLTIHEDAQ